SGTEETLLRLGRAVGLDRVRLAKDLHTQEVEAAFEEDRRTMERSRANFLTLIVSAGGKSEAKGEVFTSGPFEEMIDRFRPGLAKRAPTDILEYLEKHRDFTPDHEVSEVFRIVEDDAPRRHVCLEKDCI